ncbi:MAG: hypothetical protein GX456_13850 [Verrucomicrobia bacterium]|nr:hypothetical protein [Verrucomicrobiota bacterium]
MTNLTPVSIKQTRGPIFDRLGAAKNGRAPAGVGESNGPGSAAVPGRINTTTDLTPVSIKQTRRPGVDRPGAAKNRRAPARAGKGNGARERGRPRPHQRDGRSYTRFDQSNRTRGALLTSEKTIEPRLTSQLLPARQELMSWA